MKTAPTKDGIYRDVPAEDYHAWPLHSVSSMKGAHRSLLHYRYQQTHPPEQTASMALGTATHTAILEPDKFDGLYVASPKFDRRTNKGKEALAQFELDHPDQERIPEPDYDLIMGMRDAVWSHPVAREMLSFQYRIIEASVVWVDMETELPCKARPDLITTFDGWNHLGDLKTTKDASPEAFAKQIANLRYHWQSAHYIDGLYAVAPASRCFTFIAVENTPPHGVAIYTMHEDDIDQGRAELAKVKRGIAEAERTNEWPGYPPEVSEITLPAWARSYPND